jgi:hypothetical protein
MNRVPDRKKLRQEYLRKQAWVSTRLTLSCFSSLLFVMLFGICTMFALFGGTWAAYVIFGTLAFGCVYVMRVIIRETDRAVKDYDIPYVPPVTPSTLPAEEVLVRGAEEPNAPQETLLRATVKGEDTKTEELLRSSGS